MIPLCPVKILSQCGVSSYITQLYSAVTWRETHVSPEGSASRFAESGGKPSCREVATTIGNWVGVKHAEALPRRIFCFRFCWEPQQWESTFVTETFIDSYAYRQQIADLKMLADSAGITAATPWFVMDSSVMQCPSSWQPA